MELLVTCPISLDTDNHSKLDRSKTVAKKEAKRFKMSKTASDAILITPSQFIVEKQGVLSDSYELKKKIGQGNCRYTHRNIWNCI